LWECAVVIAMAIAAACARKGPAIGAVRPTAADSVFIDVENQGFYDASIFVSFAGSTRRRLGTAQAYSDATFTVRWEPYDLWVEVDFVGVRGVIRTAAFSMNPGETLEVQLPASSSRTGNVIARRR
jgi:hypothetical protein